LATAVQQAQRSEFELFVVNGDVARQQGLAPDYAQWTRLMQSLFSRAPVAITLGNHDDRKNVLAGLTSRAGDAQPINNKLVTALDSGAFRLVFLDSLLATNVTPGQLGRFQREWLASYLDSSAQKPVVVFVHHNPDLASDTGLVDAERLLQILLPRRQVKALIYGHTHTYRLEQLDGMHLINLPAIGYNFADGEVIGWMGSEFSREGAELRLHALGGNMALDGKIASLSFR
jgi:3',5'-cyclic AMP phosphodiesterase CpdA